MSDTSYIALLHSLSKDYYQSHISFDDYRLQRKDILDKIDVALNGRKFENKPKDEPKDEAEQLVLAEQENSSFNGNGDGVDDSCC